MAYSGKHEITLSGTNITHKVPGASAFTQEDNFPKGERRAKLVDIGLDSERVQIIDESSDSVLYELTFNDVALPLTVSNSALKESLNTLFFLAESPTQAEFDALDDRVEVLEASETVLNSFKVKLLAPANINLAALNAADDFDGTTLGSIANGTFLLLPNQTNHKENGVYVRGGTVLAPTLTRASFADTFSKLEGMIILVTNGTTYTKSIWQQYQTGGTIGTDNIDFQANTGDTQSQLNSIFTTLTTTPRRASGQITGDGATTSFALNHNLGRIASKPTIALDSGGAILGDANFSSITNTSVNMTTIVFLVAPGNGVKYNWLIMG